MRQLCKGNVAVIKGATYAPTDPPERPGWPSSAPSPFLVIAITSTGDRQHCFDLVPA